MSASASPARMPPAMPALRALAAGAFGIGTTGSVIAGPPMRLSSAPRRWPAAGGWLRTAAPAQGAGPAVLPRIGALVPPAVPAAAWFALRSASGSPAALPACADAA